MEIVEQNGLKTIALCGISTGIYGYPKEKAAHVALSTVREWLESNHHKVDRVIFCMFADDEDEVYNELMPRVNTCFACLISISIFHGRLTKLCLVQWMIWRCEWFIRFVQ
jgi:hypothetical protein